MTLSAPTNSLPAILLTMHNAGDIAVRIESKHHVIVFIGQSLGLMRTLDVHE